MSARTTAVIVPFYNRRHTVLATLASVAAQTHAPDRLLVVDDGSTDGGADLVRRWIHGHGGLCDCRLVVQANQGVSAARNHGASLAADCDYLAFLDSDDLWPPDFLERTRAALDAHRPAVATSCDRRFVDYQAQSTRLVDSAPLTDRPSLWMLEHGADLASATLFRAAAIRRRGGFNPRLRTGEDSALFMPLSLDGPWLHAPGAPVTYRRGLATTMGDADNLTAQFCDNRRTWAGVYEHFFVYGGGHAMLANPDCQRLLAVAWYQAGQELMEHESPHEALACFRKAMAWRPWRARYFGRAVQAFLVSMRVRSADRKQILRELAGWGSDPVSPKQLQNQP